MFVTLGFVNTNLELMYSNFFSYSVVVLPQHHRETYKKVVSNIDRMIGIEPIYFCFLCLTSGQGLRQPGSELYFH